MAKKGDFLKWDDFKETPYIKIIPFFCNKKRKNFYEEILKKRTMDEFQSLWPKSQNFLIVKIFKIIEDNLYWPNFFFLPKDECRVVFFEPYMGSLDGAHALLEISDILGPKFFESFSDGDLEKILMEDFVRKFN